MSVSDRPPTQQETRIAAQAAEDVRRMVLQLLRTGDERPWPWPVQDVDGRVMVTVQVKAAP